MSDRRDEVRRQLDQFVPGERVVGGRSTKSARYVFTAKDVGLTFAWFGGHGVHVYDGTGREIDFFSVGDFKLPEATVDQVKEGVRMKLEGLGSKVGPMPEDISDVAGLGPLEVPRVGRVGIRVLVSSRALQILEKAIPDEQDAVGMYIELARELDRAGFPVEANLVRAIKEDQVRHKAELEGIWNVVLRRKR